MTNKERREIIEKAKASGYTGDYVELFRTGAAQLAITPEEREKGLRPYHEAGDTGQTMAFPNTPPNTPFNTVGMKAPIRVKKVVGDKVVKDQVVPPGISSFNTGSGYGTVIEAPALRARAQEGRPKEEGFDESGNPVAYLEAVDLENYMSRTRGQTPEFWKATADTLAYHENAIPMTGSMSLTRPQIGGGPGTGLFQFESKGASGKDAFETAKQRYINVTKVNKGFVPDPAIVNAKSAADLDKEQQYALFHANLIEGPAKLSDYAKGKMSITDLWLKGHKGVEKPGDRASFEESRQAAKKDDLKKYGLRFGGLKRRKAQDGEFLEKAADVAGYFNPLTAAAKLAGKAVDKGKKRLADNIYPFGYGGQGASAGDRVVNALMGNAEAGSVNNPLPGTPDPSTQERNTLFRQVLGVEGDTLPKSEYRENAYRSPVTEENLTRKLRIAANLGPEELEKEISKMESNPGYHGGSAANVLGNYTVKRGEDEKGKYIDYYDVWDFNPSDQIKSVSNPYRNEKSGNYVPSSFPGSSTINRYINEYFGGDPEEVKKQVRKAEDFISDNVLGLKSPEIYGRVYLDDINPEKEKKRLGGPSKYKLRPGGVRYNKKGYKR